MFFCFTEVKTTDNVTEELKLFLSASSDIWINALSKFTKKRFNNIVDANMSAGIDCDKAGLKLSSISSTIMHRIYGQVT